MILVVGLGPGGPGSLPARNLEAMETAERLILRTAIHPMADWLREREIAFESCDDLYESAEDFEALYRTIAERVVAAGAVYAVPGHPLLGEKSVSVLAAMAEIRVLAAPSFVDAILAQTARPVAGALQVWNAHDPEGHWPDPRAAQIIYQIDSRDAATEAKLRLLKFFPPEHPATLVSRAGMHDAAVTATSVAGLDRHEYDPLTSALIEPLQLERPAGFYGLVEVVDRLLGPGGCPWDREQTHETLKKHMLEETYETLGAIDSGDPDKLCEELGDFLLQALMHSQMDAIEGLYDIDDVIAGITDKLARRHPHVFGAASAADAEEVLRNWDAIKKAERPESESILSGVPAAMPSLLRAFEVSKRAARVGFEWPSLEAVFEKVDEEMAELKEAISKTPPPCSDAIEMGGGVNRQPISDELADLLFALVNVARWLDVEPENALRRMVDRFTARFQDMERRAERPLRELSFEEWDGLWEAAKRAT